ncbi:glutamine synthetase [Elysia marginata]|uniref:Glutamine synthetase n=1 Tax=Elysia marginata TaxID=1093978 RepID=A0AAV4GHA0_9GAST|nr:glutamine synthetase [Elysia marginata]
MVPCERSTYGGYKVASVVCELRKTDGTLDTCTPRETALALIQRLESEFQLKIRSAFEAEFGIRDINSAKPLAHENKWASVTAMRLGSNVLMGLVQAMKDIDVRLDSLMSEFGSGQFEVTFDLVDGIKVIIEENS